VIYSHADTITKKINFMREAASVRRCHALPILNGDQYVVGLHSYNMLAMLRILWPDAPIHLVWAILEHDAPERLTGDIPAPTKWFGIVNKETLNDAEKTILTDVLGYSHESGLDDYERQWLRGLDIFELSLFCRDQMSLGNKNLEVMLGRIHNFVKREAASFPSKVLDAYWASFGEEWQMMPDLGDE